METEEEISSSQLLDLVHLEEILQPVRDVAAVWSLPLQEYLDEFLTNLRSKKITPANIEVEFLNFTQAGIFLQRSTDIYSKKVNDLYGQCVNMKLHGLQEPEKEEKGKKKRKIFEYVDENNCLIMLQDDDFEIAENINILDDNPRLEVTTKSKIPFCIMKSLDTKPNDAPNFRLTIPPSFRHFAIFLDKTLDDEEFDESVLIINSPRNQNVATEDGEYASTPYNNDSNPQSNEAHIDSNQQSNDVPIDSNPISSNIPVDYSSIPDTGPAYGETYQHEEEEEDLEHINYEEMLLNPDEKTDPVIPHPVRPYTKEELNMMIKKGMEQKKPYKPTKIKYSQLFNIEFSEYFDKLKKYRKHLDNMRNDREITQFSGLDSHSQSNESEGAPTDYFDFPTQTDEFTETIGETDDGYEYTDAFPTSQNQYFDLCRSFIQAMLGMGKELAKRRENRNLLSWEKRILPIIESMEKRPKYDIPVVNQWVIDEIHKSGGSTTMTRLLSGKDKYMRSRIFVSTLMDLAARRIVYVQSLPDDDFVISINPIEESVEEE